MKGIKPQFPNGVVNSVSFVSTTNTARSLAGFNRPRQRGRGLLRAENVERLPVFCRRRESQSHGYPFERTSVATASLVARSASINLPRETCALLQIGNAASRRRAP